MNALVASELRRFTSRRLFRVMAGLVVLGIVVADVVVAIRSTGSTGVVGDRRFHMTLIPDVFEGVSPILIIGAWLAGASFIGADWHAGTLATLLTWEPRRIRVMLARLVICAGAVFVAITALEAILGGSLALVAALRGITDGVDAAWVRSTVGIAVRIAALGSLGAVIGFAIASVARNTAAGLGVGFGYTVIVENLIRGLRPQWARWLVSENAVAFVTGSSPDPSFELTMIRAGLMLALYATVLALIAVALFRARDVN